MHTIEIGADVPRWHNAFLRWLGFAVLRLLGWRLDIRLPSLRKFVVILVPHTSNWDFVVGLAAIFAIQVRVNWWAKHTLFRWPFGGMMEWLGGIPIDRARTRGAVPQAIEAIEQRSHFIFGLAPEGTRSRVDRWKTGFYQIAVGARLPILLAYMDYRDKVCCVREAIQPTGDYAADTAKMLAYYRDVSPRHPAQYSGKA